MIYLELHSVPGLHQLTKASRLALAQACRDQLLGQGIEHLEKRVYRVEYVIHGDYYRNGEPRRRDGDNIAYALSNAIATAGGIDDKWLTRDYGVKVEQSDHERACITLY